MSSPRLLVSLVGAATLLFLAADVLAQPVDINQGPYCWPDDVRDNFDKRGQQVNGWDYFLNDTAQDQHFIPLQYDQPGDAWLDPLDRYGAGIYKGNDKFELIPAGPLNVKVGLHPNVNGDLAMGKGEDWIFRVHAKARPGGCSLKVLIVPGDIEFGGIPTQASWGAREVLVDKLFGPNEPIREVIPIKIGPDGLLQHCEWIVVDIDDPDPEDMEPDDGMCFGDPPPWNEGHVAVPNAGLFPRPKFDFYPMRCPLITEVVTAPKGAQFVEILNLNDHHVDLEPGFLSNSRLYYGVTTQDGSVDTLSGSGGIWNARFPPGFWLDPGERAVVAVGGADAFEAAHGKKPDFELIPTDPLVPDMLPAFPGSIGPAPELGAANGLVMLYAWIEPRDLVCDCDYAHWGAGDEVDKTGVSVDGIDGDAVPTAYMPDTAPAAQVPLAIAPAGHGDGEAFHRRETLPLEGLEKQDGTGNGCEGHDETSENLGGDPGTWMTQCGPTPGLPPGVEGFCEPGGGEGFSFMVGPSDPAPAIPLADAPEGCGKLFVVYSSTKAADPKGPKGPPSFKVKDPTDESFTPKDKKWMNKILKKLVPEGSMIYVSARCDDTGAAVDLGTIFVMDPTAPTLTAPADKAALPAEPLPTFDGDLGTGVKCWLEFFSADNVELVVKKVRVQSLPVTLKKGQWKSARKKLDKEGAAGTGNWHIRCEDALGREVTSEVREFTYTSP